MVSSILVLTIRELQRAGQAERNEEGRSGERAFLRAQGKLLGIVRQVQKPAPKALVAAGSPSAQDEAALNPKSGGQSSGGDSGDHTDELEPLQPLQPQRSFSVPISGPKGGFKRSTAARPGQEAVEQAGAGADGPGAGLDEDGQLLAVFRLAVWICKQPDDSLARAEKAALLRHAVQNLNILAERAGSVSPLVRMVQAGQGDLLELCIAVLCLGEPQLLRDLQTLLENRIAKPQALAGVIKYCDELKAAPRDAEGEILLGKVTAHVREERLKLREGLRLWVQQVQGLLLWLIDR